MNRKSQFFFVCHRRKGGHGGGLSSNGSLPWRKWRLRPSRRPWLVSPIALTRLRPPEQPPLFAGRLAQLTPTSREAERAAIARALGLALPAPLPNPAEREPLRDDIPQSRTVLCARTIPALFGFLSSTGIKKPSRLEWHVHPPYIPIRHRRAGSCAPIDRLHSAYGSWVFVSTSLVQELIWPCHDYDIVGRREPA
jgi:hypothetical protein